MTNITKNIRAITLWANPTLLFTFPASKSEAKHIIIIIRVVKSTTMNIRVWILI